MYIVDTDVLIDFYHRRSPVVDLLPSLIDRGDAGTCGVVTAELFTGLAASDRTVWAELLDSFIAWPITRAAGIGAGMLRYDLARRGFTISLADSLIASIALEHDLIVLTANTRDFARTGASMLDPRRGMP